MIYDNIVYEVINMNNKNDENLFLDSMEQNILHSNFKLSFQELEFDSPAEFKKIASDQNYLKKYLNNKLFDLQISKDKSKIDSYYIERYESGFLGSLALALWFMKFDEDNWFSFQQVHTETEKFMGDKIYNERIELVLLKGLESDSEEASITVDEIPVTLNYSSGVICIWQGKLYD